MIIFAKNIILDFWNTTLEMSPYLLFGFLMAGLLSAVISRRFVETHLGGRGLLSVIKASVFGVPLPLCSCSVIPVSMSLRRHGATKGSTISFLLSTPQTGMDSIFVTLSLLGPVFAVFRPVIAFVTGVVGGFLVDTFAHGTAQPNPQPTRQQEVCCDVPHNEKFVHRLGKGLNYGFVILPRDIGRAVLLGLFLAALISAFVPDNFFADRLGTGILPMFVMMFAGIPVYVCATASVPVAAAMILKGLTPGAAFVFLMTGPATNAATIVTIWKVLGKSVALIYLATVASTAVLSGLLLDFLAADINLAVGTSVHIHHDGLLLLAVKYVCAFFLMALLFIGIFRKPASHH
jgi:uncharacterized membrane protein YraQ (UPF0718 family)